MPSLNHLLPSISMEAGMLYICILSNSACVLDKTHKQLQKELNVAVQSFTETSM